MPLFVTLQNCQTIINETIMNKEIKHNGPSANELTPFTPTHPGSILKEEIEYRGISQCKLAKDMGIGYSALNEILNERRPLTEKTALLFEAALGVNAEPLMHMQMSYNMQTARKDSNFMEKLSKVRRIAAIL